MAKTSNSVDLIAVDGSVAATIPIPVEQKPKRVRKPKPAGDSIESKLAALTKEHEYLEITHNELRARYEDLRKEYESYRKVAEQNTYIQRAFVLNTGEQLRALTTNIDIFARKEVR